MERLLNAVVHNFELLFSNYSHFIDSRGSIMWDVKVINTCIFRKNRALAPHERSAVPLGTDHCPVGLIKLLAFYTSIAAWKV